MKRKTQYLNTDLDLASAYSLEALAGVERGMGFCTAAEYDEFMRQVPEFERHLVRSGSSDD